MDTVYSCEKWIVDHSFIGHWPFLVGLSSVPKLTAASKKSWSFSLSLSL